MDLVPDSTGRDGSGSDGFPFRNATAGHSPTPINGASHRATERRPNDRHAATDRAEVVERVALQASSDPAIAGHPLIQGLLVELPDRESPLPEGWMDHWLEAARAVLELLYAQRSATKLPR